jgi:uncharacterized protein (DUF1330 family)
MPAYVIAQVEVHDPQTYERYKPMVPPTLAQYGGRFLTRGAEITALSGDWNPPRLVILEFPNVAQAQAWWNSPEYTAARKVRESASTGNILLVPGASD